MYQKWPLNPTCAADRKKDGGVVAKDRLSVCSLHETALSEFIGLESCTKSCQCRIQDRLIFAAGIVRKLAFANRNLSFSADTSYNPLTLLFCQPSLLRVRREVEAHEHLKQGCKDPDKRTAERMLSQQLLDMFLDTRSSEEKGP